MSTAPATKRKLGYSPLREMRNGMTTPDLIRVEGRHRRDLGDIDAHAASIAEVGLLHPLVVRADGRLVAGARRLAAMTKLGWDRVPVAVVDGMDDAVSLLRAERDENTCRKDFLPTEAVSVGRELESLERAAAKKRQTAKLRKGNGVPVGENFPNGENGRTADKVGSAVGMSGKTFTKAKAIVEAAEADPEVYGDLPARMNAGSVNRAHKELCQRQARQAAKEFTLPEGDDRMAKRSYTGSLPSWQRRS